MSLLFAGCGSDACELLCLRTAARIGGCLGGWDATWEDLDASGQRDFRRQCSASWSRTRTYLEPREVRMALERCEWSQDDLTSMGCAELEEHYLEEDPEEE